MNFFASKNPFFLKIYSNFNDWCQQKDSNIVPVFYNLPSVPINKPFGLCIFQVEDIVRAENFFKNQPSPQQFLYIMGDVCRQTDTLEVASRTEYPLILEKGPFLSPDDIKRMAAKLTHKNFALVECGSSFGYADRVLDPRSLAVMSELGAFGICITDLLESRDELYSHRPLWLSNNKYLEAFESAAKNFKPRFYVYKMSSRDQKPITDNRQLTTDNRQPTTDNRQPTTDNRQPTTDNRQLTYRGGWDGSITPDIKLSRHKLTIMAGPCMLETLELGLEVAGFLKNLCHSLGYQYIFKSSFDKANRTSVTGARGPGLNQGLKWLEHIKKTLNVPILTDVHHAEQAHEAADVADILQIPAFLFRERHLLMAAAQTGKVLQIKKGQWASAEDMLNVARFLLENNFHKVILAERGSCFGYNNLVVDFRNLVDMAALGNAVVFDATHSVQLPGAKNGKSSGLRHMVPALTRAALAVGVDGLFMEVHPSPDNALSDADTQLSFNIASEILNHHAHGSLTKK